MKWHLPSPEHLLSTKLCKFTKIQINFQSFFSVTGSTFPGRKVCNLSVYCSSFTDCRVMENQGGSRKHVSSPVLSNDRSLRRVSHGTKNYLINGAHHNLTPGEWRAVNCDIYHEYRNKLPPYNVRARRDRVWYRSQDATRLIPGTDSLILPNI